MYLLMKIKSNVFFDLAYIVAILLLTVYIYRDENIVTHVYWTRLGIFVLIGVCALLGIGTFLNEIWIKKIKSNLVAYIEAFIKFVYIILLIICITL